MGILRNMHIPLIAFLLSFLWQIPAAFASQKSYIIYFGGHSHGPEATLADYERVRESHYEFLGSFLGSKTKAQNAIFYSYTNYINGFAANIEEEEALQISRDPHVISVFENKVFELHTTRSWALLELERDGRVPVDSIWTKARFGQGAIIANLDTGVWPESESFNDKGMGPVPSRWKGFCQNATKQGVHCNRKLIGARYFNQGFNLGYNSARDTDGHGTHTLSTAAGRFVSGASIFGYANGTAKGGSPNAHVAAYKVCSSLGCYSADILAGFDAAIHDGVDVLSVSLGGSTSDYLSDAVAIGSFHAMVNGITVVCSAGNGGPIDGSVSNVAPWILTVGASTMDREFPVYISLGNKKRMKGQSLSSARLPVNKFYPLIDSKAANARDIPSAEAELCVAESLDPKKVKGKIVLCLRGFNGRVEKGEAVLKAGGIGMILVNDETTGNEVLADAHVLPAAHITYSDGVSVYSYLNSTKSPMSYISVPTTQYGIKPAPYMAGFSSRGPNLINLEILKPDITAPGVSVLAAFTQAKGPTDTEDDNRRVPFNVESGTSMSCPHVSGIVGLLKTLYPNWSPAAIRSAIMTTARDRDNMGQSIRDFSFKEATPFAYGAGHVRPNRAMDPGLIYDLTIKDYLNFLCAIGYNSTQIAIFLHKPYLCPPRPINLVDLNYPSISIPLLSDPTTVSRTLKNVGTPGKYTVHIEGLQGVSVSVRPSVLQFNKIGEEKTFEITLVPEKDQVGKDFTFGKMIWSDGKHYVRSPLVVKLAS